MWLHRYVRERSSHDLALIKEAFSNAYPFPHVSIDNFLTDDFVDTLLSEFPSREDPEYLQFCKEDGGKIGTNYSNGSIQSFPPAFKALDQVTASPEFLNLLSAITGIEEVEYDPDYFGGGIRESQMGTFLPPHVDFNHHPRTLSHRRLNLLLYLNQDWEKSWGGNLEVHLDPNLYRGHSLVKSVSPALNRCFLFETSEISWHGFDRLNPPAGRSRRAWTVYFYTKERPGGNSIALRSTEYVEPPLPQSIQAGHTLTQSDVDYIREALVRRDSRIQMLYEMRRTFDNKYSRLWKEYEYYLARTREYEARAIGAEQEPDGAAANGHV